MLTIELLDLSRIGVSTFDEAVVNKLGKFFVFFAVGCVKVVKTDLKISEIFLVFFVDRRDNFMDNGLHVAAPVPKTVRLELALLRPRHDWSRLRTRAGVY